MGSFEGSQNRNCLIASGTEVDIAAAILVFENVLSKLLLQRLCR